MNRIIKLKIIQNKKKVTSIVSNRIDSSQDRIQRIQIGISLFSPLCLWFYPLLLFNPSSSNPKRVQEEEEKENEEDRIRVYSLARY